MILIPKTGSCMILNLKAGNCKINCNSPFFSAYVAFFDEIAFRFIV